MSNPYAPLFELTRGPIVESQHFGAFAVVDVHGNLLAAHGDPYLVTYLRSTAKPFQALPFIERNGDAHFGLTPKEVALMCASHSGTDEHVETVRAMQEKIGVTVDDLMCGFHYPYHEPTADAMKARGEQPTPYRHNCSGKHTGMLAHAKMRGLPTENYIAFDHPIQQDILEAFAAMCGVAPEKVVLGIDGCSAPNFAVPLYNAALGYARLCDPRGLPPQRAAACWRITAAMTAHPEMVGGPERFDTTLMRVTRGRIVVKGGAEGYQGMGLMPGALGPGSPGVGIAIKISDGDSSGRARHGVSLEILRLLGALSDAELAQMADFGPRKTLRNFRKLEVGESRPNFTLQNVPVTHDAG